jgi:hypothetical protein
MIPQNVLSAVAVPSAYLTPDDLNVPSPFVDYELGGTDLNDASNGLRIQTWTLTYNSTTGDFTLDSPSTSPVVVYNASGVTWVSLTFDQNMNPIIAYLQSGSAKMWWYDTVPEDYAVLSLPAGTGRPCVCFDDKRQTQIIGGAADVILAYVRAGTLYFRAQRDRFTVEYTLRVGVTGDLRRVGLNVGNRLQFKLG